MKTGKKKYEWMVQVLFKNLFLILCRGRDVCSLEYSACRSQKEPTNLELQAVGIQPTLVVRTKLGNSASGISALNHWALFHPEQTLLRCCIMSVYLGENSGKEKSECKGRDNPGRSSLCECPQVYSSAQERNHRQLTTFPGDKAEYKETNLGREWAFKDLLSGLF